MPQYKLHTDHFLDGARARAGSVVEFDGLPGSEMEPLDDAGWERFHEHAAQRKARGLPPVTRFPFAVIESKATGVPVRERKLADLPENWRELKGLPLTNLAIRLGAARGIKADQAAKFIEAEEANRAIAEFSGSTEGIDGDGQ